MESHLEIIGESNYLEKVQKYVANINIIVWTKRTRIPINETIILRNLCIETLLSNGVKESELKEGSLNIREHSLNRRRVRQEVKQKIIISCSDISRLIQGISKLEPLFKKPRYSLTLSMNQPVFGVNADILSKAKKEAIQNAYSHAKLIATQASVKIENTIRIEELTRIVGEYEVYNHDLENIFLTAASNSNVNYINIENAVREITLRYRVIFGIKSLSEDTVRLNSADFG